MGEDESGTRIMTEIETLRAEITRLRALLEGEGIDPDPQPEPLPRFGCRLSGSVR